LKLRKLAPPLGGRVGAAFVEIELGGSGGQPALPERGGQQTFEDPDEFDLSPFGLG
jgi:hypothetical protein